MTAMFTPTYINRCKELIKQGRPFWEPRDQWYFAVQREYHTYDADGKDANKISRRDAVQNTRFSVRPVFKETSIEVWPNLRGLQALDFGKPYPNLLILMHDGIEVWYRGVTKGVGTEDVISIGLRRFEQEAIVAFVGLEPGLSEEIRKRWIASPEYQKNAGP